MIKTKFFSIFPLDARRRLNTHKRTPMTSFECLMCFQCTPCVQLVVHSYFNNNALIYPFLDKLKYVDINPLMTEAPII